MLACPHCNTTIVLRELKHEGFFATHRICPNCNQPFDLDSSTKHRQKLVLAALVLSLTLTVFAYLYGGHWILLAVASYVLIGGLLIYGTRRMYLVNFAREWQRQSRCKVDE